MIDDLKDRLVRLEFLLDGNGGGLKTRVAVLEEQMKTSLANLDRIEDKLQETRETGIKVLQVLEASKAVQPGKWYENPVILLWLVCIFVVFLVFYQVFGGDAADIIRETTKAL